MSFLNTEGLKHLSSKIKADLDAKVDKVDLADYATTQYVNDISAEAEKYHSIEKSESSANGKWTASGYGIDLVGADPNHQLFHLGYSINGLELLKLKNDGSTFSTLIPFEDLDGLIKDSENFATEQYVDTKVQEELTSDNIAKALGYTPLNSALKGSANGLAELDANGKVLSSQLPSYVDDVIEGTLATFPKTGETGKIYVDTATNKSYRWSGSKYVEISASLALGETSSTAYRGDKGKIAYDHSQTPHAPATINGGDYIDVSLEGDKLTIDASQNLFDRVDSEYITSIYEELNQKANQSDVNIALDKKADLSVFDGSYYLGNFNNKTIAELQTALDTWLETYWQTVGASAYFGGDFINAWNSGDTNAVIPAGGYTVVTVSSRWNNPSYVGLMITSYSSKNTWYVSKTNGVWQPIYKFAFKDELEEIQTQLDSKADLEELDKKANQNIFDGSYSLGSFNNKTLAELQTALDTWLSTNNDTMGASVQFNSSDSWINLWNSKDLTTIMSGGGTWSATVTSRDSDLGYVQLRFSRYRDKMVYYACKYAGTWHLVYKVAFEDEVNSLVDSKLTNKANKTHTHDPNDLILGEYTKGGLDPISRGWVGSAASNKSLGLPAESVYVEYSTNGGSTWTPYSTLDGSKLFDESRSASFYLGGSSAKGQQTTDWQLRVTITSTDRYCSFDSVYQWMSDNGNTVVFDLERSTIGDPDNFTTIISDQPLDGWAGNNIHYFYHGTFCNNADQPYNHGKYRLTYKMTAVDTNYLSAEILDIRFFGVNIWGTASASSSTLINMLKTGTPYTFDVADKKVIFPNTVKATTFEGNALTASTASNASKAEYATFTETDAASGDSDRRIYFASSIATDKKANLVHNDNFTYNPAQGDLKVNKINGKKTNELVTYIAQTNDPGENTNLISGTLLLIYED